MSLSKNGSLQSSRQDTAPHRLHRPGRGSDGSFYPTPLHKRPTKNQSKHHRPGHGTSPMKRFTPVALRKLTQTQGAKSIIFIAYQISTEHVQNLRRWQSYKAYWILNALEVVFWGAMVFLVMQANLARCVGVGCKLSWAVMALGIVLKYVLHPAPLRALVALYVISPADNLSAYWHLTSR